MKYDIYRSVIKGYRNTAIKLISKNKDGGQYFADMLEQRIEGINGIALNDADISNNQFRVLLRYKRLVFKWNLDKQWREI